MRNYERSYITLSSNDHKVFPSESKSIEYKEIWTSRIKREICAFLNNDLMNNITKSFIYLGVNDKSRKITHKFTMNERHLFEERISKWSQKDFYPNAGSFIKVHPDNNPFCIEIDSTRSAVFEARVGGKHAHYHAYVRIGSLSEKANLGMFRRLLIKVRAKKYDSNRSYNQHLTFNYLKNKLERKHIPFHLGGFSQFYTSNQLFTNTALIFSDQNPFITKSAKYDGINTERKTFIPKVFTGSILKQIDDIIDYVNRNYNHVRYIIMSKQRLDILDYPKIAIREAVVNALAHRTYYSTQEFSLINIYSNRIEIKSPGALPDGLRPHQVLNHHSDARNPSILSLLKSLNYAEQYGSGLPRIRDSYKDIHGNNRQMKLISDEDVSVILPNINYNKVINFHPFTLPTPRQSILQKLSPLISNIRITGPINRRGIQKIYGIKSATQGKRFIKSLIKMGLLIRIGKGPSTKYKLRRE